MVSVSCNGQMGVDICVKGGSPGMATDLHDCGWLFHKLVNKTSIIQLHSFTRGLQSCTDCTDFLQRTRTSPGPIPPSSASLVVIHDIPMATLH